jgi:hypothetical protein
MAVDKFIGVTPKVSDNKTKIEKNESGVLKISRKGVTEVKTVKKTNKSGKGEVEDFDSFEKRLLSKDNFISPVFENYDENESIILGVPIIAASIEKTVDFVVGDSYRAVGDKNEVIKTFMREQDFDTYLRTVTRHLLLYGNCYTELISDGDSIGRLKILSPKTMRVRRNSKGKILGYVQISEKNPLKEPIHFGLGEIAHFKINMVGNNAYGTSIIHPMRGIIAKTLKMENNTAIVVDRKTNAPMHVKLGNEEYPATAGDVDNFKTDLQIMKANHEWVTGHAVEMNVIGFQGKILDVGPWSKYLINQLVFGTQVPLFLLGVPEGSNRSTAAQQMDAFDKRRQSIQLSISSVVEEKIFIRVIVGNVQLVWGTSKSDKIDEIKSLSRLLDSRLIIPSDIRLAASKKLNVLLDLGLDEGGIKFDDRDYPDQNKPDNQNKSDEKPDDSVKKVDKNKEKPEGWGTNLPKWYEGL